MMNLKNTVLAITLILGTTAFATDDFKPKLIIKNETGELITFFAPASAIEQLKAQGSNQIHTFTIDALVMDEKYQENLANVEMSVIKLNPQDTLTLDAIPEYLTNRYTRLLSPEEYDKYLANVGVVPPGTYPSVYPIISPELYAWAQSFRTDIRIYLEKDAVRLHCQLCEPDDQYLIIAGTDLIIANSKSIVISQHFDKLAS